MGIENQSQPTHNTEDNIQVMELDHPIDTNEIRVAIGKLKTGKAAGSDRIPVEFLKCGGEPVLASLRRLFNAILVSGTFPNEWKSSIIVPIPKCTNPTSVDQFRGISLISVISKCFCGVIRQRLTSWADRNQKLPPAQFGFRKGHTVDNLFVLSALTQRAKKFTKPLYSLFGRLSKSF